MSAVVSEGKLYYTYSGGSGLHRSHLGQLTVGGGKLTIFESGPLLHQDCFVKRDGATLRLEKGEFKKFNHWIAGQSIGAIAVKESGFSVIDDVGKPVEALAGKTIKELHEKK